YIPYGTGAAGAVAAWALGTDPMSGFWTGFGIGMYNHAGGPEDAVELDEVTVTAKWNLLLSPYDGFMKNIYGMPSVVMLDEVTVTAKAIGKLRTLQTGGHTLNKGTLKALGLTREQGKNAIETLKKTYNLPPDAHFKIMSNGNYGNPHTGQVIDNILDFVY
ncbi:MAG: hypothetical protein LBS01_03300, partial [Prevotellaceae bacterium]|nr:hypothetical protein [Prevotellaceae bacterium]